MRLFLFIALISTSALSQSAFNQSNINFTNQSSNKNFMLLDFIGAAQGYTNLTFESKISDQMSASGFLATRLIENDDKSVRSTEAKGFLVNRYIIGDVGTSSVSIGLGPISYIDLDGGQISKGMAFGAHVSGQLVLNDKVIVRAYGLGSQSSAIGRVGIQVGIGF